jgi:uncharacterized OB-fold protein
MVDGHIDADVGTNKAESYDNRCVCCGEIIPEGRQVCPNCERPFIDNVELRMDWHLPIYKKEHEIYEEVIKDGCKKM